MPPPNVVLRHTGSIRERIAINLMDLERFNWPIRSPSMGPEEQVSFPWEDFKLWTGGTRSGIAQWVDRGVLAVTYDKAGVGNLVQGAKTLVFADVDPDTITRSGGSFVTDGFTEGMIIDIVGSTDNNGSFQIALGGVAATVLTLVAADALVAESTPDSTPITIDVVASAGTFTRGAGDFVADGFVIGQRINISGFTDPGNNTIKTILTVTNSVITVTDNSGLVDESGGGNEEINVIVTMIGRGGQVAMTSDDLRTLIIPPFPS